MTGRIPVRLFTDSESTLESVASSQQIVTKTLRIRIVDLNEILLRSAVTSYAWLPTEMMWADILTKEKKLPDSLEDILLKNAMNLQDVNINKVKAFRQKVRMTNIQKSKALETPTHQ